MSQLGSAGAVDGVEGLAEVAGKRAGGGDGVLAGLDLDECGSDGLCGRIS
jgi:hypothetical protein